MLIHTFHVGGALSNLKVGWQGQNRSGGAKPGLSLRQFALLLASAVADTLGPARIGTGIVFTGSGLVAEPKTGRRAMVGGARRLPDNEGD